MSFSELPEEFPPDDEWRDRALAVIPGGASTGSKRPDALYGTVETASPTHFISANGCIVTTPGGAELIDCSMALGAVSIGYAEQAVVARVMEAVGSGNTCGLSSILEVEVAERLCEVIPCAEQVRFLKSGAEAMSAAVRLARAYTGRTHIVVSGYFGWHDWAQESDPGVPASVLGHVTRVPFDDEAALRAACGRAGDTLAAVVLEPVVERLPSSQWISAARELCDRLGAVLIFDEMKTGFRLKTGGYQQLSGVEPDLAAFGKALANGFPLAAVVGRADVMQAATRTWISSTLASEASALAAASAVLDWHEQNDVCADLEKIGTEMRDAVENAIRASGLPGVRVRGLPQMWLIEFDDPNLETQFLERAVTHGVLFKRGAYNYPALAHDEQALRDIERVASTTCVELREEMA